MVSGIFEMICRVGVVWLLFKSIWILVSPSGKSGSMDWCRCTTYDFLSCLEEPERNSSAVRLYKNPEPAMLQHAEEAPSSESSDDGASTYFIFQFMQPDFRTWYRTYFQLQAEHHIYCIPAVLAAVAVLAAAVVLAGS